MTKYLISLTILGLMALGLPSDLHAQGKKRYSDHEWSKNCQKERRRMMNVARQKAFNWCRSRGGVDKRRTDFIFIVDKGMRHNASKTHFCEVKGDIVCSPTPRDKKTKRYSDRGWSKDCRKERRRMMDVARQKAFNWCRSRGGVDKRRTNFIFIVDKGMRLNASSTHFCEVKGDIVCN